MTLTPTFQDLRARALTDLRMGVPVVVDGAYLVAAVESLTAARLLAVQGLGAVDLVLTARRAQTLNIMQYDDGLARVALPADADLRWCRAMADPTHDLAVPMKGPFAVRRGGAVCAHRAALELVKDAQLLPAVLMAKIADIPPGLTQVAAHDTPPMPLNGVAAAPLPLAAHENARLHIYRPKEGGEEHYAILIGTPDAKADVLVRLHSACFTGDVLGSLKCDCGPQLNAALAQMAGENAGVLLYLNQEGRGIGLANKMRAYALQHQGFDTVEANHRLGFEDDERDFRIGAHMLKALNITRVRLLSNNPAKGGAVAKPRDHGCDPCAIAGGPQPAECTVFGCEGGKIGA